MTTSESAPADHYEVLGLSTSASPELIRQTYRRLAKVYHPDVNGGDPAATRRWLEIQRAYDTLSDPASRGQYDRFRADQSFAHSTPPPNAAPRPNPSPAAQPPAAADIPLNWWRLFVPSGRVNRRTYTLMWPLNFVIALLAALIIPDLSPFIALALLWIGLCTAIKRLHDQGISSWFLLLSIIPIVPVIFLGMCLFAPGQSGTTKHGPQPPRAFRP